MLVPVGVGVGADLGIEADDRGRGHAAADPEVGAPAEIEYLHLGEIGEHLQKSQGAAKLPNVDRARSGGHQPHAVLRLDELPGWLPTARPIEQGIAA